MYCHNFDTCCWSKLELNDYLWMLLCVYLQQYLWAALCSAAPVVQTCWDPEQCFAPVRRTSLLLLHLTRTDKNLNFYVRRYKVGQSQTFYTTNTIHIHHLRIKISCSTASLADNVLSLDTVFVFWWIMVRVFRITSAVGIVYGEHVDGDDLQHVSASQ